MKFPKPADVTLLVNSDFAAALHSMTAGEFAERAMQLMTSPARRLETQQDLIALAIWSEDVGDIAGSKSFMELSRHISIMSAAENYYQKIITKGKG